MAIAGIPEAAVEKILRRLYDNSYDTMTDIDPDLFRHSLDSLNAAVDKAVISVEWGKENKSFVDAIKFNNGVFAAFKTHRQQNDLKEALLDGDGKLKDFNTFRKDTVKIIGEYNVDWLKTEYDAAVKSARTAAMFVDFERDADLYPNIEWLESSAVHPREAHKKYAGTVRAMGDPWFMEHYPGSEWGCQCDITNTDRDITHNGDSPAGAAGDDGRPSPGLNVNPYYSKAIFSSTHPYVTEAYLPENKLKRILIPLVRKLLKDGK